MKRTAPEPGGAKSPRPPAAGKTSSPSSAPGGDVRPEDQAVRRAATALTLIGRDEAAAVLRRMEPALANRVLEAMSQMGEIDPTDAGEALKALGGGLHARVSRAAASGPDIARDILARTYGAEEAERRMARIAPNAGVHRFAFLEDADGRQLAALLRDESVPVLASIVASMPGGAAARLLDALPDETRVAVVRRVARLGALPPETLGAVEERLRARVEALHDAPETIEVDGEDRLAGILKYMDLGSADRILQSLGEQAPDRAEEVRRHLTTPDDLARMPRRDLERLMQRIDDVDVAIMIKALPSRLADTLLDHVSQGRRQMILDQRASLGPMRRRDVERVVSDTMQLVRRLVEEGELSLPLPGERWIGGNET